MGDIMVYMVNAHDWANTVEGYMWANEEQYPEALESLREGIWATASMWYEDLPEGSDTSIDEVVVDAMLAWGYRGPARRYVDGGACDVGDILVAIP